MTAPLRIDLHAGVRPGEPTSRAAEEADHRSGGPLAWRAVLAVAAVKVVLNLLAAPRYGWHRDELYYADAGRHLAAGFVDFPPLTALLAAAARLVTGASLVGLRSFASLAGAATIVVVAAVARELGGGRRAQVLAAIAVTPMLVGSNAMFQTVSFDQLGWALVIWAAAALLVRGPTTGGWVLVGSAAALAWSTKYTVGVLLVGLAVGWLATRAGRVTLRGGAPWLAGAIVVVVALPNLWWQARHGWPSVDFFAGRNGEVRGENPPWRFVLELALLAGPLAVPLALSGLRSLVRDATTRPLGIGLALVAPAWLVAGGKSYYAAPLVIGAFAAGAVRWEQRTAPCPNRRLPAALAASALLAAPFIAPFLPTAAMVDLGLDQVREDYAEMVGWPELAAEVDTAAETTGTTVVVAANYGVAGAVERFGTDPAVEVVSGHVQWRYWTPSPRALAAEDVLLVGYSETGAARRLCRTDPTVVGRVTNDAGVDNEEDGVPILRCTLRAPLADLRADLVH
ncbi:glycosyltransferase family 39 protein [Iamia sp. SCSIO 61187]|uniref:glycosyltransferase family 39 protein n=1 Tax=Iamia sp. SCSIO 61187 TaxID=2722752 RepID=UPI001C62B8F2|nr:glycosyltransferase family 39 protein [Iamia sp. SCSIO 61187]QYG94732.1 glycosyltransferase family 39 protein [Iamia sp. SCSIO 61187]